ncbi:MAG: GNAT family N-acetyltransferase [bacterium]
MPNHRGKTSIHDNGSHEIKLRDLRIDDYDDLIRLWDEAELPYKPEGRDKRENIDRELVGTAAIFLVAEIDGKLTGSIFGTHDGRKGWINRLAVAPTHRRKGLAARLLQEVEKKLYDKGIEIIACLIEDWNKTSMEVFQKMGYKRHNDIIYLSKRKHENV